MVKNTSNQFVDWFKANILTLAIMLAGMLIAWGSLNARVNAMENKVALYPSEDFFTLKFQTIDDKLSDIQISLGNKVDKTTK